MMCKVTFLMQSDYKRDFELKECSAMLFFHDSVDSIYQQAKKKWILKWKILIITMSYKSENISMLISELSNIRYENISLKIVDNAVDKICDVLVGNALDLFGKKQISTNVSKKKKRKKLLLRNHGLYHLR